MTEKEAMTKMCPMQMCASDRGSVYALDGRCRGADCMAWRWWVGNMPAGPGAEGYNQPPHGYCGLAGKTER
jgi:hypothetical protein